MKFDDISFQVEGGKLKCHRYWPDAGEDSVSRGGEGGRIREENLTGGLSVEGKGGKRK